MRGLLRACSPRPPLWRLGTPQGDVRVALSCVQDVELRRGGEVLHSFPMHAITWHTCVLPSKQHALCLTVPGDGAGGEPRRELLLRTKSRQQPDRHALEQPQLEMGMDSFGSPVAGEAAGAEQGRKPARCTGSAPHGSDDQESDPDWPRLLRSLPSGCASPRPLPGVGLQLRSAPASPMLPGLPLVARQPSASAPASPSTHVRLSTGRRTAAPAGAQPAVASPRESQQLQQPAPPPSVPLLAFSGRASTQPPASHVQCLEAAVAQLSAELAQSRAAAVADGSAGAPLLATDAAATTESARQTQCTGGPIRPVASACRACGDSGLSGSIAGGGQDWQRLDAALRENALLLEQQLALEAELGRMQSQLGAAASDNIRLAQEAASTVRQLQCANQAAAAGREREQQLRASLEAAAAQCEGVGRELAALSGKLEARTAQCSELEGTVEALGGEKTLLTAALATAQLQLKDATPAGWAAEASALKQQVEAAGAEAAQAKALAAAAEAKLAAGQRRETEAVGHLREAAQCMEAAQAARATALERERALAGELRELRGQLAGRLPEGDPTQVLQERVPQLEASGAVLLGQVQQLQAVGQELSSSCQALEAGRQAAVRERDALQAQLAQAQATHTAAEQRWEQQRQQLEASLGQASGRLAASEDSAQGSKARAQELQAQVASLQRDLQLAQQRGAAREQELQAELKLLAGKAEAEVKAARERGDAAQEQLRARDAELAAMRTEAALAEAAQKRLREDARREAEGHAVATRALQLEVSSAQAEAAHLAQELREARGRAEALGKALEDTQHAAQQARAQGQAAADAHSAASQQRKELQALLERAAVERDRAERARDAERLERAGLQHQCRLLAAVAGQRSGTKENAGSWPSMAGLIKAHRGTPSSSDGCDW